MFMDDAEAVLCVGQDHQLRLLVVWMPFVQKEPPGPKRTSIVPSLGPMVVLAQGKGFIYCSHESTVAIL